MGVVAGDGGVVGVTVVVINAVIGVVVIDIVIGIVIVVVVVGCRRRLWLIEQRHIGHRIVRVKISRHRAH